MNIKTRVTVIIALLGAVWTPTGYACEPCMQIHNLEESLVAADAVVIGTKIGEAPYAALNRGPGGPDWIEVRIRRTLKGEDLPSVIKINAWDGMCAYGFLLEENKDYLLLLAGTDLDGQETQFQAVFYGCGVKAFEVAHGHVLLSEDEVPLAEFKRRWFTDPGAPSNDKYMISSTYCEQDADCAVRDGACGPEAMNIFFDNSQLIAMQPYVECSDYIPLTGAMCQNRICVGHN